MAESVQYYYGTGRRKSSTARVFLTPGTGQMTVNGKTMETYFGQKGLQLTIRRPLELVGAQNAFDCMIRVQGSGPSGQADAIVLGIARALVKYDERDENSDVAAQTSQGWRQTLRQEGLLTRDAREVERKKIGKRKARRGTQYSKR